MIYFGEYDEKETQPTRSITIFKTFINTPGGNIWPRKTER
jgi:hypothetical protein